MRYARLILLSIFLVTAWVPRFCVVEAEPRRIVVPDDYSSIQEAVDAAREGDVIYVMKGVYHENVGIDKGVSLIGADRTGTVIDGAPEEGYRIPVGITGDDVSVSGFTLRSGYAGIQMGGAKNCVISDNRITDARFGVRCISSSSNNITGNVFDSISPGSAIRLELASHNIVNENYIYSCTEGIQCMQSANYNLISENIILDVNAPGISLQNSIQNTITQNTVKNSGCGISIYIANHNTIKLNNFINNTVNVGANEWYARQWGHNYSKNEWGQNHYSDYQGTDQDRDGVGDTPYPINERNQDSQPLMEPVDITPSSTNSGKVDTPTPVLITISIIVLVVALVLMGAIIYTRKHPPSTKSDTGIKNVPLDLIMEYRIQWRFEFT